MLLYPGLTQLDLTGPFELLARLPEATVHLAWKSTELVRSETGLGIAPTTTLEACPAVDLLFIPGGYGQIAVMDDTQVMEWVARQGRQARWVTAVCTGSLVLGAAGLLDGYEATTHWAARDLLASFGAKVKPGRVIVDRNRITAGGVTAGIDFGLTVLAEIAGEAFAKEKQLELEYDPAPPFRCGHPDVAERAVTEAVTARFAAIFQERRAQLRRIMAARAS
jgi:cyclohexyl-isocyanide hydratase